MRRIADRDRFPQRADDGGDLLGRLAPPVHHLGKALAQRPVGVDPCVRHVDEGQPGERLQRLVGLDLAASDGLEERAQSFAVHDRTVSEGCG